jgi:outer membrane beta-barrel protein
MRTSLVVALSLLARAVHADGEALPAAAAPKQVAASDAPPEPQRTTEMCIDQTIADRLAVKRKRRGAVDRLYVKAGRHEISLGGGYYDSDLLSGTYIVGAGYTYHMTEETAIEFSGWFTHANADLVRALESMRGEVLTDTYAPMLFAESVLQWSPVYGKLRAGGTILHFDLHGDAGVGVVDSGTSRGAAGVLGFGFRIFVTQAIAVRIDARDRTFRQEVLQQHFLVDDLALTASLSLFLPLHN